MQLRPEDTTPEAWRIQQQIWRRMGPERRLATALSMSDDLRRLSADGIRHRHPEYSEVQVRWALDRMLLGDALFARAYPKADLLST